MKKALLVLLLTLTMLFTFGCGGDDQKDGTATDVNGANQVIIAIEPDYVTMDPGYCYEMYAPMIVNAAYDTLFRFTKEDEPPVPHLVDTYEVSPDNLVYTFELKPDIKFASGNPLTAADVKFSFDRMKYLQSNASSLATGIKSVEAKDDTTVIVTLSQPDSAFLAKTTYCSFGVLDSKVVGENGGI
ncbi:MAG: ABC transporter substrate-binding protein, partial [Clostridiales bacterium]